MSTYSVVTIIPGFPLVAADSVRDLRSSQLPWTRRSNFYRLALYAFDIGATTATLTITIARGTWAANQASINSSSNCTKGNGSFMYAAASVPIANGGTYTWTFSYDSNTAISLLDPDSMHIGANYDPHEGWIVSQSIGGTSVPEPASLTLLGLGLFGVPFLRRKK